MFDIWLPHLSFESVRESSKFFLLGEQIGACSWELEVVFHNIGSGSIGVDQKVVGNLFMQGVQESFAHSFFAYIILVVCLWLNLMTLTLLTTNGKFRSWQREQQATIDAMWMIYEYILNNYLMQVEVHKWLCTVRLSWGPKIPGRVQGLYSLEINYLRNPQMRFYNL